MRRTRLQPLLPQLALLLLLAHCQVPQLAYCLTSCTSEARNVFYPVQSGQCGSVDEALHLVNAQLVPAASDLLTCTLACALSDRCAAVQFRSASRECHVTAETPRAATGGGGGCSTTLVRRGPRAPAWPPASRLFALYDFRVSGVNLVSPRSLTAEFVGDVIRGSSGASLPGSRASFISIPVASPGFQALSASNLEYSFFISARGVPALDQYVQRHLLRIIPSTDTGRYCAFVYLEWDRVRFANLFSQRAGFISDSSIRGGKGGSSALSFGVSYSNKTGSVAVFHNGAVATATNYGYGYFLNTSIVYDEIRLGFEPSADAKCFNSTFVCFAAASVALTPAEFQLLSDLC